MMHEDIVCNRRIDAGSAIWASRYDGETYFFCSLMCRERFQLEPGVFLPPAESSTVPPALVVHIVR